MAIFTALSASIALADEFKTISGKEYKNVTVSRVEPDGIVLRTKSGISKIYFVELPKDVQERFHYDAAKPVVIPDAVKPLATSGIETLPQSKPVTVTERLHRIGATCRNGSESGAIGRGACSRHGGVRCWKLSDGTCQ